MKTDRKFNIVFLTTLLLGIVLFAFVGVTYAYFQVENEILGNFKIGMVDVAWCNDGTVATEGTTYNLAGVDGALVRGDEDGCNVTHLDGSSGGIINLWVNEDSADVYLRVKPYCYVVVDEEEIDLTQYLTFKCMKTVNNNLVDQGFSNSAIWGNGSDGWYYYLDIGYTSELIDVCNNVVMSPSYPTSYTGMQLYITFEFEALQYANAPVNATWGSVAQSFLGNL